MKGDTRPTEYRPSPRDRLSLVDAILDAGELRNTAIVAVPRGASGERDITAAHSPGEIGPTEKRAERRLIPPGR